MTSRHLDSRITEQGNPRTAGIDLASPREIFDLISAEDHLVAAAVATQREQVARAIELAEQALRGGGRILYVGAGTSGRLGVLDAAECPPTFGSDPATVVGVIAGGEKALTRAIEGAEDDSAAGSDAIDSNVVTSADLVVGIAASGTTPFVRAALRRAGEIGASRVVITCTPPDSVLADLADVLVVPIVGPEVVTGSTRMKSGTATKMVLNMISTGAMIRIGKTYGNLMVDLRATNQKLADRSRRIVMQLGGVDAVEADALLGAAEGSVKAALAMKLLGVPLVEATGALDRVGGVLRRLQLPTTGSATRKGQ